MPNSKFKSVWNLLVISLVLYTASVSPYRLAFADDYHVHSWTQFFTVAEVTIDIIFTVDIFINFMTGYERFNGSIELRPKYIAINYLTSFFIFDFLATFPFELIVSLISGSQQKNGVQANSLLRLVRLQRLQRLTRILRLIKLFSIEQYSAFLRSLIIKYKIPRSMKRLIWILLSSFLCVHLFACFYFLTARFNDFNHETFVARKEILE